MAIGERIGKIAKSKQIPLRQIALSAGISYNTLYAIVKRNSDRIEYETLKKIADVLDTTPAYLIGWNDAEKMLLNSGHSINDIAVELDIPTEILDQIIRDNDVKAMEEIVKAVEIFVKPLDDTETNKNKLLDVFSKLNETGQKTAVERIEELTKIPEYRKDKQAPK